MLTIKQVLFAISALALIAGYPQESIAFSGGGAGESGISRALIQVADEEVEGYAVIRQAREYSEGWKGIGVVIYEGKDVSYSAEQLGRGFVQAFTDRGVPAQAFTDDLDDDITSIIFFLDAGYALGPFNASDALDQVLEMVRQHKVAQLDPTAVN